jgi:hypothetical protein
METIFITTAIEQLEEATTKLFVGKKNNTQLSQTAWMPIGLPFDIADLCLLSQPIPMDLIDASNMLQM